jgi:hypothetical protein
LPLAFALTFGFFASAAAELAGEALAHAERPFAEHLTATWLPRTAKQVRKRR